MRPLWPWAKNVDGSHETGISGSEETGIRILLISSDEEYRSHWQQIFDRRGWVLECADTLTEAMDTLRSRPLPVVVYDSQAADEEWREVVTTLRSFSHCPCILLTSSVIDDSFGDEVVRLHGYDLFSRHADEDEIARTINSAWFWKHRHV
jgi:ActR/RegA family two-component response regulator